MCWLNIIKSGGRGAGDRVHEVGLPGNRGQRKGVEGSDRRRIQAYSVHFKRLYCVIFVYAVYMNYFAFDASNIG